MDQISVQNFFSSSKAYFIAVNTYDSPAVADLQTPVNDVKALSAVLHQLQGFTIETVACKTDDGFDACIINPLLNPGSDQLLRFLRNLTAGKNDRVLLYFACHGIAIDSEGNPEGYLLAADATPGQWDSFIKMSEVLQILTKLNCKHLLLVLDCCYAGAFRWAGTTRGMGTEIPKTIYYEKLQQYTDNKTWQVLTSTAHDQKAIDTLRLGRREGDSNSLLSPFAELLVKALQTGDADLSFGSMEPDGLITATELSYYLQQSIFKNLFEQKIEADKRQLPMLFPVIDAAAGLVGKGEFLFQNPSIKQIKLKSKKNTTNPYKGLDAYTKDDNTIFYGRQRVLTGWIDGKTENIGLLPASEQFQVIILTGPSGIGKSSLAKAGLLAYYKDKKKLYDLRPGKTPWSVNEMILTEIANSENAIVLVDQYEELVTVCASEEEREKFEKALVLISKKNVVVVTIRSDFENQLRNSPLLQIKTEENKLKKYRFVVPPFERNELEEIVLQPAMQELLEFKPINNVAGAADAFVDAIVDDAFQNPGSLPLLSMALSELWEKRDNNNLLEQTYYDFGGITGILDRKANEEFNKLSGDPESQLLFKQLIFRMVSFEGGRISRRRIYTVLHENNNGNNVGDELILDTPSRTDKIKDIAENLGKARLIKSDTDESGNSFIEPSHDALLRSWVTLSQWLRAKDVRTNQTGQETIVLLRSVADAVNNQVLWDSDPRLPVARRNIAINLNSNEEQFIKNSIRERNYNKRIRGWAIGVAVSIITALGIFGWVQAVRATERAKKNQALFLASESDKYGETERLAMLKNAYTIYEDPSIEDKTNSLLNKDDYYNPFAIDKTISKDSIVSLHYTANKEALMIDHAGLRQKYDFINHTYLPPAESEKAGDAFLISSDQFNVYIENNHNNKQIKLKNKSLIDHSRTDTAFVDLLVSNSLSYSCIRLDGNGHFLINHRLNMPNEYTNISYFKDNGYFAIDSSGYSVLFDPTGRKIDTHSEQRIIGIHVIRGHIAELLQDNESGAVYLAEPGQKSKMPQVNTEYNFRPFSSYINSYLLADSLFLLVVNNPPVEGPGGQSTSVVKCDFKNSRGISLVEKDCVFNTFELSPDKRSAIATSEADSFYSINLERNQVTSSYYAGLEKAVFGGKQNTYCIISKSAGGYINFVFDSSALLLNRIEYSLSPDFIQISDNDQFISACYGAYSILTWELSKPFNPKPWGDALNNETSYGSYVVNDLTISNSGRYIYLDATIEAGQGLRPVHYLNKVLQPDDIDETSATTKNYYLLPNEDSLITYTVNNETDKLISITCTVLPNDKTVVIDTDGDKQKIITALLAHRLPVTVQQGILAYTTTGGKNIVIDSADHFIKQWRSRFFLYNNELVNQYNYTDTSFVVYTPSGIKTYNTYPEGKTIFKKRTLEKEEATLAFIYGNGNESSTFREKLKLLTGYDLQGKDSLHGFIDQGNQLVHSDKGTFIIKNEIVYVFNMDNPNGFDQISSIQIAAAALYKDGNNIILVAQNGTIYLKKTRKYLKWFLENGYTIPLDTK